MVAVPIKSIELAIYLGPPCSENIANKPQTLLIEFESDHLDVRLDSFQLRTDRFVH